MRSLCCVKPSASKTRCRVLLESTEKVSPPQSVQNFSRCPWSSEAALGCVHLFLTRSGWVVSSKHKGLFLSLFHFFFPNGWFSFLDLDSLVHVSYGCFFSFFNHQAHRNKYSQKTPLSLHCRCWFILYWIRLLPFRLRLFPWENTAVHNKVKQNHVLQT